MGDPEALDRTIRDCLTILGPLAPTIERRPRSTIEPGRVRPGSSGERALEVLHSLRGRGGGGPERALEIEGTLGEGGMGVVRLATQLALGRKVAVKTLRGERVDESMRMRLLREAWVTGALEHPNVVPIYDVGLDGDGRPVIVLKRIEGVSWADLIVDGEMVRRRFGTDDPLEWNLHTLMQVCNAVHFAHDRGIVHRDLKPENVMVGAFGEVYVVDWGLAVSTTGDGEGRFMRATDAREMAGTPAYMAPEMLGGNRSRICPQTDVYLLGALLYEVLTGRPPHDGERLIDIVRSVVRSDPPFPENAPPELVQVCRRAMCPDPEGRYADADGLRTAILDFLRHRGSSQLAAEAESRLGELQRVMGGRRADPEHEPGTSRAHLYHLFGESRFGFRQALRQWPDNDVAREGLARALATMADYELEQGDVRAASLLVAEMEDPPHDLVARVAEAEREREREDARRRQLEKLHQELDPDIGKRTRVFMAIVLGTLWTSLPIIAAARFPHVTESLLSKSIWTGGVLAVTVGMAIWARESLGKTLVNRRVVLAVLVILVSQLVLYLGAALGGFDRSVVDPLHLFLYFVGTCMAAVFLAPHFVIAAVVQLACFVASVLWPELSFPFVGAASFVLVAVALWAWRAGPELLRPDDERR